jgi:hypothetical protein
MALRVKREGKQRNDSGKDQPGDPETAHIHEFHDVTQNSRLSGNISILRWHQNVSDAESFCPMRTLLRGLNLLG